MTPRPRLIVGNWKMHKTIPEAVELVKNLADLLKESPPRNVTTVLAPPFTALSAVASALTAYGLSQTPPVSIAAQDMHWEDAGAFTGEVSPIMLKDVGCRYVIVGHSERRHGLGETDPFINTKVHAALNAGLDPILCVGETSDQRKAGRTEAVLDGQLVGGLQGLNGSQAQRLTIAYEPVWAIGTGVNATPEQAQEAHAFIRRRCADLLSPDAVAALTIQYGGSVKSDNAAAILAQPDVDGALVGGASLKAD